MRRGLLGMLVGLLLTGETAHAQLFPTGFPAATPQPAPPVGEATAVPSKSPSVYADFVDMWGRTNPEPPTAIGIVINEYGVGKVIWTTGDEAPGTIAAGRATAWFNPPQGRSITGSIYETNDERVIGRASITLTLVTAYVAHLSQGATTWTLCSATIAGQALAAGQPEPPCTAP